MLECFLFAQNRDYRTRRMNSQFLAMSIVYWTKADFLMIGKCLVSTMFSKHCLDSDFAGKAGYLVFSGTQKFLYSVLIQNLI